MAQAACTGRTQLKAGWGARARAESTLNISRMVVTLDVSKLSGWLNATACCQVEINRGHTMRGEVRAWRREVAGDRGAGSMHGRAGLLIRAGHGEERTLNMYFMVVTLEVSKLSGWLNNDARCRESKGGHTVWCEV